MVFLVQRGDARAVRAAAEIDPVYAGALAEARAAGVQALAVQVAIAPHAIVPWRMLPVQVQVQVFRSRSRLTRTGPLYLLPARRVLSLP